MRCTTLTYHGGWLCCNVSAVAARQARDNLHESASNRFRDDKPELIVCEIMTVSVNLECSGRGEIISALLHSGSATRRSHHLKPKMYRQDCK